MAHQVTNSVWTKLNETRKLAKSDAASLLATLSENYHIAVEDETHGSVVLSGVLGTIVRSLDYLSGSGTIVRDAIHSYSLNTIVLYEGDKIPNGPYEGAMADYELDEARMYVAAARAQDDTHGPLALGVGEHNVGKDFRTVFAHEIGHLVMPAFEEAIGEKLRITYDMYPVEFWRERISTYAGTDDHEMFGEAFAAWTHVDYGKDGHKLPAVMEILFTKAGIESGPMAKLEKAKRKRSATEVLLPDGTVVAASTIDGILDVVDDADWFEIEGVISPALLAAFEDAGYAELNTAGVGANAVMVDKVSEGAKAYAESHSAELVEGLSDTTRDQLRGTIEDAVEEGWSKAELTEEINNSFAFGDVRSELIARNELGLAYSKGRQDAADNAGATGKRSLLSADHDDHENCDCSDAADAGTVDFDSSFTDDPDYDFPPYHVNCECDWVGVYGSDDDDDDEEDDEGDDEEHGTNKFIKGGPDQERDDHGRFTATGMSDELTDHVDRESSDPGKSVSEEQALTIIANTHDDERIKARHRNEARRILRQHYGKFAKGTIEARNADANARAQSYSDHANSLKEADDIAGQRLTDKAVQLTDFAIKNNAGTAADHRKAADAHQEAAQHYRNEMDNDIAADAHDRAAAAHDSIVGLLDGGEEDPVCKSDEFDGILPDDYPSQAQITDEEMSENDTLLVQSSAALKLSTEDDEPGQRIAGRANRYTMEAATNYGSVNSRAADHHIAYDIHSQTAKNYTTYAHNNKPAAANTRVAEFKLEIHNRLLEQAKKFVKYDDNQPRDAHGRWGDGPGYSKDGKVWKDADGKKVSAAVQQRLDALKVPPAWTNVRLNPDKNGDKQAMGRDAKGRIQSIYSAQHSAAASAEKFARLRDFNKVAPVIRDRAYKDMNDKSKSQEHRDTAAATALIAETGMRVGSNQDTGAEKKAFGASNMKAASTRITGDTLKFNFIGKKGVTQNVTVTSPKLAAYIGGRKDAVGGVRNAQLFNITSGDVRDYVRSIAGDQFSTKDFRTWVGTATALSAVSGMKIPKTEAQYKSSMKAVGKTVGAKLGNTASVALKSYIDPTVFAAWGFKNGK